MVTLNLNRVQKHFKQQWRGDLRKDLCVPGEGLRFSSLHLQILMWERAFTQTQTLDGALAIRDNCSKTPSLESGSRKQASHRKCRAPAVISWSIRDLKIRTDVKDETRGKEEKKTLQMHQGVKSKLSLSFQRSCAKQKVKKITIFGKLSFSSKYIGPNKFGMRSCRLRSDVG